MRMLSRSWLWPKLMATLAVLLVQGCSGIVSRKATPPPVVTAPSVIEPQVRKEVPPPEAGEKKVEQVGEASWYGSAHQGKTTASGEPFNQNALTAAHPTLPLGSEAVVTNLETGKSVEVTINDRGPYVKGRKIDLSRAAAQQLGMTKKGVAKVKIQATVPRKSKRLARRHTIKQRKARSYQRTNPDVLSRQELLTTPGHGIVPPSAGER